MAKASSPATKPVYVFHGDDAFLRDAAREEILSALLGEADPQLCVASFDATAELADVLDELRTIPFLAPHRVVIVRDADAFIAAFREELEKYLQSPSPTASLILMVSSWPKGTRLYKVVDKVGRVLDCSVSGKGDLGPFIRQAAQRRGKKIAPDAAELLAQWIGEDLAALDGEVEKLSLYAGEREVIEGGDVAAVVTATTGPADFALTNALTAGDARAALEALGGMLTRRGEEFKVLGQIGWHLRKVLRAQQLIAAGESPEAALSACRVFYGKREFLNLLRRRAGEAVRQDFRRMIRADLGMKSGVDASAALQRLVVELCT